MEDTGFDSCAFVTRAGSELRFGISEEDETAASGIGGQFWTDSFGKITLGANLGGSIGLALVLPKDAPVDSSKAALMFCFCILRPYQTHFGTTEYARKVLPFQDLVDRIPV